MNKTTLFITLTFITMLINTLDVFAIKADKTKKGYHPVVQELKNMYNTDKDFKLLMDDAIKSAVVPPNGWPVNPENQTELFVWPEKNFDDLLNFFQNWLHFVPNATNGMDYYIIIYSLCYNNDNALRFVNQEPGLSWTKRYVEARGEYMDSPASVNDHIATMKEWKNTLGAKWNDYEPPHSANVGFEGYKTFNEFFTRNIKEGKRPVNEPLNNNVLTSPADGIVNIINENLSTNSRINTKYDEYLNVDQLLGGSEYAKYFIGGTATGTVLLPPDYHHYHSPITGKVVETKALAADGGVYFGMDGQFFTYSNNGNVGGYKSQYGVFGVYHRGYYIIKTKEHGYIAMIAVGLDDISSINFEKKFEPKNVTQTRQGVSVNKGEKIGHFAYGGSTVILLFEPGVLEAVKLNEGAQLGIINKKKR
jgi:phosphatidylserine decarboxylase